MTVFARLLPEGYVHRDVLIEGGWRPDRLRAAMRAEGLELIRRQWIVAPAATPAIREAAALGGHLTCITAGVMLGLWRPHAAEATTHLALASHSSSVSSTAVVHRSKGIVSASPRRLVDPIENVLVRVSTCFGFEDALAIWESAIRLRLVTRRHLLSLPWRGERARRLVAAASTFSDSGLETLFVHRLHLIGIVVRQQVTLIDRPVDGLIGARLVVQIDGFAHHGDPKQRRSDLAHDRALRLLGYTVLRYTYHDVIDEWPRVEAEIRAAMAQGLHVAAGGLASAGRAGYGQSAGARAFHR